MSGPLPLLRKTRQNEVRLKIKVGWLITRLQMHIDGKVDMSPTQLKAADILLKKILPDLSNVTLENPDGSNIFSGIERVIVDQVTGRTYEALPAPLPTDDRLKN